MLYEYNCFCKICGSGAVYLSRKENLTEKEQKELEFTCNDCMWKIFQGKIKPLYIKQLSLLK